MKTIVKSTLSSTLWAALAIAQTPQYTVIDLGTLAGGTSSYAAQISNSGLISGHSDRSDGSWHAVISKKSLMTDLSQFAPPELRGLNSVLWSVNERGQGTGQAETSTPDPNGEDFCGFAALGLPSLGHTCLPFVWENGTMKVLPTLGGPNGSTNRINNRGEVVGFAETAIRDPGCPAAPAGKSSQLLQFKPVLWSAEGKPQELAVFPGDTNGLAFGLNDSGQAVGASGSCTAFDLNLEIYLFPAHALLWQNGTTTDLKSLGGSGQFAGNIAIAINNQGHAVGNSDVTGDTTFHAFLWTKETGMQDLPPLAKDFASVALGLNDRDQVVGVSLDGDFNLRATLWENGVPIDLNSLIPANSGLYLQLAESINARGEIVGFAQTANGQIHSFLATPREGRVAAQNLAAPTANVARPVLSEGARKLLERRMPFGRFGARLRQPR